MSLAEYRKKRKFKDTPEPAGVEKKTHKAGGKAKFCVQKHYASHLHYDLRLELDGVLKSWAVPKGPSLNPEDKRLAMMVEDHPLSYVDFEGEIPPGNYGAGRVILWDIGTYEADQEEMREGLKRGHIDFKLTGKKLRGLFSLIKIKGQDTKNDNAWLLIKKEDKYISKDILSDAPKSQMPHGVRPMLATLVDRAFDDPDWLFEIKWDGYRAIAEIEKKSGKLRVNLYSRHGLDFSGSYPEIFNALKSFGYEVVVDGEIIAHGKDGKPSFQALQDLAIKPARISYVLFDILYLNGRDLTGLSLVERKEILKSIIPSNRYFIYSEHVFEKGIEFFRAAEKMKLEGVVGKRKNSIYETGHRSKDWVKIKTTNRQEAIIAGFTAPRGSRKRIGALVLGVYEGDNLVYIGHTGGGFNETSLETVYKKLVPLITDKPPFEKVPKTNAPVTWVKPKLVCEVKFENWTKDKHMRQPIFLGLRKDKPTEEVVREKPKIIVNGNKKDDKPELTHPDKVLWPEKGYTKGDLYEYYDRISEFILPYLKDRPENLNRHPNGVNSPNFFHKNYTDKLPSYAKKIKIHSESAGDIDQLVCNNKETLLFMANLGCIEINPWTSRIQNLDRPDFAIIDLDPHENSFEDLIKVAKTVYKILNRASVPSYIKTSGKSGLHILIPLGAKYSYEEARLFVEIIVTKVNNYLPDLTSLERSPKNRGGKIYLDFLQNSRGQTVAAPYSLRPTPEATVSTPLKWSEVRKGLSPKKFTIRTIFPRIRKYGDIWKGIWNQPADMRKALKNLEKSK